MKTLVFLLADYRSLCIFDKCFSEKSAFDLCLEWAQRMGDETVVLASRDDMDFASQVAQFAQFGENVVFLEEFNVATLLETISRIATEKNAQNILYSYADTPFLNDELTKTILDTHIKYLAEYTFADGYPYGFSPEALASGCATILSNLAHTTQKEQGEKRICRTSIFDLIKTDINSFEIETVLSKEDYRLFRMKFDCGCLAQKNACLELYNSCDLTDDADSIAQKASQNKDILKTLPYYYDVQISEKSNSPCLYIPESMQSPKSENFMKKEDFANLLKKIEDFSGTAIINLSGFGEPLLHPQFTDFVDEVMSHEGLRLLIETDGVGVTEELCEKIKSICEECKERLGMCEYFDKILWIVKLDAISEETYRKIHLNSNEFSKAQNAVPTLQKYFPKSVYAQFTRMNQNEEELEKFYRFWSDKNSPSNGNVTIQKYSSFCKSLPDYKPCDLSPLEHNPCWHIRRDFTVLANGDVPLCREMIKERICGNAFEKNLSEIWQVFDLELQKQMNNQYCEKCRNCDEYYTFNF